ncbi:MAG: biopolymer transporter ExbD [Gammaproteobacteria bacterium]|nr:biopolymer transporter ExbD [Gammaproteobacteria bacterium]MDH5727484.1 biopolymer transporter ExbD [Gammaproteobacteria bacterium]
MALSKEKNWRRQNRKPSSGINLVSLMDIFTILVFFLLVNSSEVEVLPGKASVRLPESVSQEKPRENLVIMVNQEAILVQGRKVVDVDKINANAVGVIDELQTELQYQFSRLGFDSKNKTQVAPVTIMGDKSIPYHLLKKIMLTCAQNRFGNISLAVQQKADV